MRRGLRSGDAHPSDAVEAAGGAERSHPRDHRGEAVWPCQTNAETPLGAVLLGALSADLAQGLGLPLAVTLFPNSGAAAAALQAQTIDVSFMPVDATRRQVLDFGPGYYDLEGAYLASDTSGITDVAQVDRPGIRVVAIDGTSTIRASARTLRHTQPMAVPSVAEAVERMRIEQADVFALSRDTLQPIVAQVPGSRIVSGGFQQTQVAVVVPKGRSTALVYVTTWLDSAKRSGLVRKIFDSRDFTGHPLAP